MTEWLLLGVAALLILANGVFVAAEFSFITVDRATVERRAADGDRASDSLLRALRTLSTQLSGAQLGITVTSLVVGYLAEPSLATILREPVTSLGLPEGSVRAVSATVALGVATAVQMTFGELVPKNWAIAEPLKVGRRVASPQRWFTTVSGPLLRLLNGFANRILLAMGIEPREELASARSPQELASLVTRSGQEGTLDSATASIVSRSIEIRGRNAADVMTPRPQVEFLSADQPVSDVVAAARRTGHSRFPVTGEDFDEVVGMVHFKHVLTVPADERDRRPISFVMRPVREVPATVGLQELMAALRGPGLQMAVVVDEYGGTAGIVTLEDVVEEIVGEIEDEQDRGAQRHRQEADGTWLLSGMLRPDEASEALGLELPESEQTDTLGGLLVEALGRIPEVGDAVTVSTQDVEHPDDDGVPPRVAVELTVERLDGRRVDRVRLRRLDEGSPPEAPEDPAEDPLGGAPEGRGEGPGQPADGTPAGEERADG